MLGPRASVSLWTALIGAVVLDDPVDPADVVADSGVDAGEVGVGTADAPGDDALKVTVAHERAARIALATLGEKKIESDNAVCLI